METKPLKTRSRPGYPVRDAAVQDTSLLFRCVPEAWKHKRAVAAALLAFTISGCKTKLIAPPKQVNTTQKDGACRPEEKCAPKETATVAPLFLNGDGRGAFGCVAITSPSFLSEDDARKIIIEELKKENIVFDQFDKKIPGLKIPQVNTERFLHSRDVVEYYRETGFKSAVIDAYNSKLNFGVEYISIDDYTDLGGPNSNSTVIDYDMKMAAMTLRREAIEYRKINLAVFYDPLVYPEKHENTSLKDQNVEALYEAYLAKKEHRKPRKIVEKHEQAVDKYEMAAKENSLKLLRAQVHDFIEWAKKEKFFEKAAAGNATAGNG